MRACACVHALSLSLTAHGLNEEYAQRQNVKVNESENREPKRNVKTRKKYRACVCVCVMAHVCAFACLTVGLSCECFVVFELKTVHKITFTPDKLMQ